MIKPKKSLDYVSSNKQEQSKQWRLKLDKNENIYGCHSSILNIIKNIKEEDVYKYPNYSNLTEKIAKKFNLQNKNILFANGSNEALKGIFEAYLEQSDEILIYQTYKKFIDNYCKINNIKYTNFANKEDFSPQTKIVYISTPNNINGKIIRASFVENLLKEFPQKLFIIDCSYIGFSFNVVLENYIDLSRRYENIVIIKSYSKDFALAGIRFALIISNDEIVKNLNKTIIEYSVNSIALKCASMIINNNEQMEEIKELNQKAKNLFMEELNKKGFHPIESEANFILCDFNNYKYFYYEKLKQNSVIVKKIDDNLSANLNLNSYLRITIPTIGGVKFICELLNKKDVLIFTDSIIFENCENIDNSNEIKTMLNKEAIKELTKKYDIVMYSKYPSEQISEIFIKNEISEYFYLIYQYIQTQEPNPKELSELIKLCPFNKIKLISADIKNLICANMINLETIGVIMPNKDFNHAINNFKHIGIKNILSDFKNFADYIIQIDNSSNIENDFIII